MKTIRRVVSIKFALVRPQTFRKLSVLLALALVIAGAAGKATAIGPIRIFNEELKSKLVKKTLPYNVILPRDYGAPEARNKRYPVVYLLHGLTGHFSDWTTRTQLSAYSRQHDILIVTPEGNNGWYTDSATVPDDKYETYFFEELIPEVDRKFRTIQSREGRAVAGLSMGGYGALKFGVKYPNRFAFVGSMSGALDAATWTQEDLKALSWIWKTLVVVFGDTGSETRRSNDLVQMYRQLSPDEINALPYIYLDCGTEDPLLSSTQSFSQVLLSQKIPHQVRLLPGTHSWSYWDQQVVEVLRVATTKMVAAQSAAASSNSIQK